MFIYSFSGFQTLLNEVPKCLKGKKLHNWVCKCISKRINHKFCCWEIEANLQVARVIMFLTHIGKIKVDNKKFDYPYVEITII